MAKTVESVLKKEEARSMKVKALAQKVATIFKLSEDYDSDESDIEDDMKWLTNTKKIRSKIKKLDAAHL